MLNSGPPDIGADPARPAAPPPVHLPRDVQAAVIDRARVEALTRTATLVHLVEYALREMPRGWKP
ncbi:hypothetical protein [Pseudonocardia sp. 73-21]|uniref:hypothetical protein n=1 Tax=Pseudonocardia sp. 73-21 TaxID=1895809 RepID=UPI00095F7184|nr:hypothetical protein [Pseudonocardia sp. 73-21]OJY40313.1 MAG: hypothetical protein BGP03_00410 [Pseudonocardia sp. 73-21]